MKEANLLDSIGSAHMEQEIQKKGPFKFVMILAGCLCRLFPFSTATITTDVSSTTTATCYRHHFAPPLPPPLPDDSGEDGFSDGGDCSVGFADPDGLGLLSGCGACAPCWSDGKSD